MAGTLLVYDAAFPRARVADGPILNTPGTAELRANGYPEPYQLLPIREATSPEDYFKAMGDAATKMGKLDRFIIFGHGRVVNAAVPAGYVQVTTGIVIGASDITPINARNLPDLRRKSSSGAQAELWVCDAAAAGGSGEYSGTRLCQSIADALGIQVLAATITQQYSTEDQRPIEGGGWQSTAVFLPWEGTTVLFRPGRRT
jgi:hypothetical protein